MLVDPYLIVRTATTEAVTAALDSLTPADIKRARRWLDAPPEAEDYDDEPSPHVLDLALHEPNLRGVVPFQRFMASPAALRLSTDAYMVAREIAKARYSVWRVDRRCGNGLVLQDQLYGGATINLLDHDLSRTARPGNIVGLRVFEAGESWLVAGAGAVRVSDDRLGLAKFTLERTGRPSWPEPLAAQLLHEAMWGWASA